jgi:hypothetical protein
MARSIDPLVVGRVVGDVIDMFVPSVDLAVQYTSRQVKSSFHVIGDERSKVLIFFFSFFLGALLQSRRLDPPCTSKRGWRFMISLAWIIYSFLAWSHNSV